MTKSYRPWSPLQPYLLPPSPLEWLPKNHLVYFILDIVSQLDVSGIERVIQGRDARGERPYEPRMMLALLLYGYCVGIFSSRRIARATYEDVAVRVVASDAHPHFTTINQFRLEHREAFATLYVEGLRLCAEAGLIQLGHVSLDGAKILANASKHKAMSYKRMKEEEQRLRAEVDALLAQADAIDRAEDELYGEGRSGYEIPEELGNRETRRARIAEAKAKLEREAAEARAATLRELAGGQQARADNPQVAPGKRREAATRARKNAAQAKLLLGDSDEDDPPSADALALPRHRVPATPGGKPKPKAQRNFTDPDSRIMVKGGTFVQAYNAQIVVDGAAQVIVAQAVTNQPPDVQHLRPMLERVHANLGRMPDRASADSGYFSDENVTYCERHGIDAYISVGRESHEGNLTTNAAVGSGDAQRRMRTKLQTLIGRATYSRRKTIAEPPFGQIQAARGFRRFSLRGQAKVRCEWSLVCLTHNLLKLFRCTWRVSPTPV